MNLLSQSYIEEDDIGHALKHAVWATSQKVIPSRHDVSTLKDELQGINKVCVKAV